MENELSTAAPDGRPTSIEAALDFVREHAQPVGAERVLLVESLGRILAEDVAATAPVPAHASSAMDGYAFRHADLPPDRRLPLHGRVVAGHPLDGPMPPGHATRIFTGAMVPAGADTVAMQEHCTADDICVVLPELTPGRNVRLAGDDLEAGAVVLTRGLRLRPQDLGIAASVGRAELAVSRPARVAVITTGDELRSPGVPLPPGCIYDSNRHTISGALRGLGAAVTDYGVLADDRAAIREALRTAAAENDLVISTGGVSVGDEDHVRPAVEEIGSLDFWRLPLKPGRPVAVGDVAGVPFLGLPGNPVSSTVAFWLIGRPWALHLMGAAAVEVVRYPVIADFTHARSPGRREFLRARLEVDATGTARVSVYRSTGSGMLSSLVWSDGLVELLEDAGDVAPGDVVRYIPYFALAE